MRAPMGAKYQISRREDSDAGVKLRVLNLRESTVRAICDGLDLLALSTGVEVHGLNAAWIRKEFGLPASSGAAAGAEGAAKFEAVGDQPGEF